MPKDEESGAPSAGRTVYATARHAKWELKLKSRSSTIIRIAVGITLLGALLWTVGPMKLAENLRGLSLGWLGLALLAQVAAKFVWAMRWQEILRASNVEKGLIELVGVLHVGFFFNNFLPSSMGGDVVRGYYTSGSGNKAATAYGAVIAERLIGFIILAAICAGAIVLLLLSGGDAFPDAFLRGSLLVSVGVLAFSALILLSDSWVSVVHRLLRNHPKVLARVQELARAIQFTRQPGCRVWYIVLLSALVQVIGVMFYLASARAVGITLHSMSFFFIVPLAVIASMVPISLNGLGLREGALVGLLQGFGVSAGAGGAFAVLARLVDLVFAAVGGVIFLFGGSFRNRLAETG